MEGETQDSRQAAQTTLGWWLLLWLMPLIVAIVTAAVRASVAFTWPLVLASYVCCAAGFGLFLAFSWFAARIPKGHLGSVLVVLGFFMMPFLMVVFQILVTSALGVSVGVVTFFAAMMMFQVLARISGRI